MMLGDLPAPAPEQFWQWVLSAGAILWIAVNLKKLFWRHPPIEADFTSRREFEAHLEANSEEHRELRNDLTHSTNELHAKINQVANDTAFIRGKLED